MCSLNDDTEENCENFILREKPFLSGNTTCRSCSNKALVVLRKKDAYCRDCFLSTETHKFRAALGKSKMMKPQDKALVAFSGSQSSVALLHLIHSGATEEQHKKFLFTTSVLYIDEAALLYKSVNDRKEIFTKIKDKVSSYGFSLFVTTLSESLKKSPQIASSLTTNEEDDDKLINLFNNVKSMSSKEDLLYLLRQKLLIIGAKQLNCNKLFTAEVGTDLAVKLLSSFSLGRGDQASFETGFCDFRYPHCKILRPLRDFTRKEIVYYNKFHSLEEIVIPSLTTKATANVSIRKLTEKFITDLQEGFPSTVYTIFRTGEKLSVNAVENDDEDNVCLLCNDKIRTNSGRDNYTAVEAANFSRNVSRKKINNCAINGNESCCGSCSDRKSIPKNIKETELEKYLCYGCSLIARDMKNIEYLPQDLLQTAIQKRDFESMKEQISEFLIEQSSELEV